MSFSWNRTDEACDVTIWNKNGLEFQAMTFFESGVHGLLVVDRSCSFIPLRNPQMSLATPPGLLDINSA